MRGKDEHHQPGYMGNRKKKRKEEKEKIIVNVYHNHLRTHQMWNRVKRNKKRRALTDTGWDSIIDARGIILENFNAQSCD